MLRSFRQKLTNSLTYGQGACCPHTGFTLRDISARTAQPSGDMKCAAASPALVLIRPCSETLNSSAALLGQELWVL